jgi:acyl carrier protein
MNTRDQIRQYLFGTLIPTAKESWPADEADLHAAGLDSLRLMQLLVFIEERVGVNLPDHELTPERTASVSALVGWIEEHRKR